MKLGWVDCSSGVSGDMLLGALDQLGGLDGLPAALAAMPMLNATVHRNTVLRAGLSALQVDVQTPADPPHRHLGDVLDIVAGAVLPDRVRHNVEKVFRRLAAAEAAVHGVAPEEVEFHEVGAVDAIVDIVGVCLGLDRLGIDRLTAGPVALGGGTATSAHGVLPVPAPAVLQLLADTRLVAHGGPVDVELATPTGVALLAQLADAAGPMPAMEVTGVGRGAGSRDIPGRPNVLRLVTGTAVALPTHDNGWALVEANVDDLDPRLWPAVIDALFAAGAADAWLTPILMKKGRPAHTVSALVEAAGQAAVLDVLFRESSTIGARSTPVGKHALPRQCLEVRVEGETVRVKVATLDGDAVTVTPEWEDVAAAARVLGRPAKTVLADAVAAARVRITRTDG